MSSIKVIDYRKEFGNYTLPDGMEDYLRGLSLEKQVMFFTLEFFSIGPTSKYALADRLEDCKAFIVKDDILIGIATTDCDDVLFALLLGNDRLIGEEECDNNGAGYKTIKSYVRLIFTPDDNLLNILKAINM